MSQDGSMRKLCEACIRRAGLIGALYGIVPTVIWFALLFALVPFRSVYVLRCLLALILAGAAGAFLNRFGLSLWLLKHRSPEGPATLLDGIVIGGWVGVGMALLPPLVHFIATNHPEQVKTGVLITWLGAAVLGALLGGVMAAAGREYLDRSDVES